jgi:two-component system cell cycle sensor histidine kinase/response regulator CckA
MARSRVLTAIAIGLFLLAAGFCGVAAWRAAPSVAGVVLLLAGLAGVVCLGALTLRSSKGDDADDEAWTERLAQALPEPAALTASDGRILASNIGWRAAMGEAPRLPAGGAAAAVFAAFAAARRGEAGRAQLSAFGAAREATVSLLAPGQYLVRLAYGAAPAEAAIAAAKPSLNALDAFAAAWPFGAALLDGPDPFEAAIVEANPALAEAMGASGVQTFGDLIEPRSRAEALAALPRLAPGHPVEVRLAVDPGRAMHLYLARAGDRWAAYLIDVSGQKQIELQLAQSQKMQAIGQLAGGVAHDFNNLLTAILMQLDALSTRHPVGDPSYEGLNEIRQTSIRAADLVRKLLAFSRKQTVQREVLDLGELISEFEVLLRRVLYEDVRLETDYGRNLPLVRADRGQLETAVMNLAVNASDAVRTGGGGGGVVRIRTARLSEAEAQALGYPEAEGEQALIEVSDDGPGIAAADLDKIFEPFFTTKPVGEGTGLGLATVYGIVKQAEGWVAADSAPGEGARFRIFLPVHAPAMIEPAPAPMPARRSQARDLSGAGRILFVEDEDAVRGVAARLLRARGYEVIEAASGEEALGLAEANAGRIDLMISDVVMPGMQGPELLKQARRHLGEAPVMFISGYAEAEFSNLLEGERNVSFLPKPIDIKTLAERVKHELGRSS